MKASECKPGKTYAGYFRGQLKVKAADGAKIAALAYDPLYSAYNYVEVKGAQLPASVKKAPKAAQEKQNLDENVDTDIQEPSPADGQDRRGAGGPAE
jgi:hypothetical protein